MHVMCQAHRSFITVLFDLNGQCVICCQNFSFNSCQLVLSCIVEWDRGTAIFTNFDKTEISCIFKAIHDHEINHIHILTHRHLETWLHTDCVMLYCSVVTFLSASLQHLMTPPSPSAYTKNNYIMITSTMRRKRCCRNITGIKKHNLVAFIEGFDCTSCFE